MRSGVEVEKESESLFTRLRKWRFYRKKTKDNRELLRKKRKTEEEKPKP